MLLPITKLQGIDVDCGGEMVAVVVVEVGGGGGGNRQLIHPASGCVKNIDIARLLIYPALWDTTNAGLDIEIVSGATMVP